MRVMPLPRLSWLQGAVSTPLIDAVLRHDAAELGELLRDHPHMLVEDSPLGRTPLQAALEVGCTLIAKQLLDAGANPNELSGPLWVIRSDHLVRLAINPIRIPPLLLAIALGNQAQVELLIAAGANVNASLADGTSALILASINHQLAIVRCLVSHGARSSFYLQTYLPTFAAIGQDELIEALLPSGINIDAEFVVSGIVVRMTLLTIALFNRREKTALTLIRCGADPNLGYLALRPLSLAIRLANLKLVDALLCAGADPSYNHFQCLRYLIFREGLGLYQHRRLVLTLSLHLFKAQAIPPSYRMQGSALELMRLMLHPRPEALRDSAYYVLPGRSIKSRVERLRHFLIPWLSFYYNIDRSRSVVETCIRQSNFAWFKRLLASPALANWPADLLKGLGNLVKRMVLAREFLGFCFARHHRHIPELSDRVLACLPLESVSLHALACVNRQMRGVADKVLTPESRGRTLRRRRVG